MFCGCAATTNDEIVADLMTFITEWLYSHYEFQYAPVRSEPKMYACVLHHAGLLREVGKSWRLDPI